MHRVRHLAAADRAPHVLVQRPARRLPSLRRARPARRDRPGAGGRATSRGACARGSCWRGGAGDRWRWRPSCRARWRPSGSIPTLRGRSCPTRIVESILYGTAKVEPEAGTDRPVGSAPRRGRGRKVKGYVGIVPRLSARLASAGSADAAADRADDLDDPDESEGGIGDDELGRFITTRVCDVCRGRRLRPEALAVTGRRTGHRAARCDAPVRPAPLHRDARPRGRGRPDVPAEPGHRRAPPPGREGTRRVPHRRRPRLPGARPERRDALERRGAAHPPRDADRRGARRRPLRPGRAVRRAPRQATTPGSSRPRRGSATSATRSSWWSTTARPSWQPITWSTWAPAPGSTAEPWSPRGRPPTSWPTRRRSPGAYLSGTKALPIPTHATQAPGKAVVVGQGGPRAQPQGRRRRHPRSGCSPCVTGVSGSGKSSLIVDTLLPAVRARSTESTAPVGACDGIEGLSHIDKVDLHRPGPHRPHPTLQPGDVHGVFAQLRELYAGAPRGARARLQAGALLVQRQGRALRGVPGRRRAARSRCTSCRTSSSPARPARAALQPRDARGALPGHVHRRRARPHRRPGLRVLRRHPSRARAARGALAKSASATSRLGQPATTLSGGEAQRVKLARELARKATGQTLYVLDEPTTGLHFRTSRRSSRRWSTCATRGTRSWSSSTTWTSIACADWVIDLGPEGGSGGGQVVATGRPEAVAANPRSHTGRYLREVLERARTSPSQPAGAR